MRCAMWRREPRWSGTWPEGFGGNGGESGVGQPKRHTTEHTSQCNAASPEYRAIECGDVTCNLELSSDWMTRSCSDPSISSGFRYLVLSCTRRSLKQLVGTDWNPVALAHMTETRRLRRRMSLEILLPTRLIALEIPAKRVSLRLSTWPRLCKDH
ncbi:hypothetical protein BDW74DRAFT_110318 [Aspergillus multicolor]|uniref:uncharacterized protein n=1 Tax=Aspergillus multicolor TaxID=41759 RepID=UPI003CCE39A3